jgi:NADPH:quinone reductase-like Zn-dependent oxidoreductase
LANGDRHRRGETRYAISDPWRKRAVGSFAAQLAKWKGAEVIATASRPSFGFLRRIGVDKVIDYNRERFEDLVHDVDVVIEHFGGDIQERSWSSRKKGGC